jgi:ABC-type phosphate/phosphonate transport system substrate-binding protein
MNSGRREEATIRTCATTKAATGACVWILRALLAALLSLSPAAMTEPASASQEAEGPAPPGEDVINIGYSSAVFAGVSKADALAAMKVWLNAVAQRRGIGSPINTTVYEDTETMAKALEAKKIDILVVLSGEYLRLKTGHDMTPTFLPVHSGLVQDKSLLLVRRDSGVTDIGQLKGKNIMIQKGCGVGLGEVWLNSLLLERGYPQATDFFAEAVTSGKTSATVLRVFFGQSDAALISSMDFQALVELNPQLGQQLVALEVSQAFVPSVICVRDDYEVHRDSLLRGMEELHLEPKGQQVLMLFKVDKLVHFEDQYFDTARDILRNYESLKPRVADRGR